MDVPIEFRVDEVTVTIRIGKWRGSLKLDEFSPAQPLRLFPKDDGEVEPYGRALEEALGLVIERASARP